MNNQAHDDLTTPGDQARRRCTTAPQVHVSVGYYAGSPCDPIYRACQCSSLGERGIKVLETDSRCPPHALLTVSFREYAIGLSILYYTPSLSPPIGINPLEIEPERFPLYKPPWLRPVPPASVKPTYRSTSMRQVTAMST